MNNRSKFIGRLVSSCLAALLVFTLGFGGGESQALSLDQSLASAGKSYLSSVVKDYVKDSEDTYASSLKKTQKLVNSLAEKLEAAADPDIKVSDRASILTSVNSSKAALTDLAADFSGLATETETFDAQLQASVEDLLKLVKGDLRNQLSDNKGSFKKIAATLTDLATTAGKVDGNNLDNLLGSVGDNITSIDAALDRGVQSLKALAE